MMMTRHGKNYNPTGLISLAVALPALLPLLILNGCGTEAPSMPDGEGRLRVTIVDTSGIFPGGAPGYPSSVDSVEIHLTARSHQLTTLTNTGMDGQVFFDELPTGDYSIYATRSIWLGSSNKVFSGGRNFRIAGNTFLRDTLRINLIATSDLMINEIFYAGSDASSFYFYGQFAEIYNASSDTMYLDGMILTRQRSVEDPELVDYVQALYGYQFPGTPVTGREYPIAPGQFVVVAADAIDHTMWCPRSVDLSGADWETFNALSNDYDNPDVPNLEVISDRGPDWMISLGHDAVVLATGEEYTLSQYVSSGRTYTEIRIPVDMVVDGIEYASDLDTDKQLTTRVDAGFAGLGISRYSGQSAERRELGLDTNDSTYDFEISETPTPGYSHVE